MNVLERLGIYIARPRLFRPKDGGEIKLNGVTPEVSAKIQELLENDSVLHAVSAPVDGGEVDEPTPARERSEPTPYTALGTFQDKEKRWCVVVIKFNDSEAFVQEIIPAGMEHVNAEEQFKIKAVETGIIR